MPLKSSCSKGVEDADVKEGATCMVTVCSRLEKKTSKGVSSSVFERLCSIKLPEVRDMATGVAELSRSKAEASGGRNDFDGQSAALMVKSAREQP